MGVRSGGVTDGSLGLPYGPYQGRWYLWGHERSSQGPGETPGLWEVGYLPAGPFALRVSLLVVASSSVLILWVWGTQLPAEQSRHACP